MMVIARLVCSEAVARVYIFVNCSPLSSGYEANMKNGLFLFGQQAVG